MESVGKKIALSRRYWIPLALAVLAAVGVGVLLLAAFDFDLAAIKASLKELLALLASIHPAALFLAIAILPCLGVPVSPLLVAGGLAYGKPIGLLIGFTGMAVNNALSYGLAAYPLRRFIEGVIHSRGWKIPEIPKKEEVRVIIVFRITPGFPLPFQNYLLGLARVSFGKFMVYSLLAQTLPIIAFVATGGALFEGSWGLLILGVVLLIVMTMVAKIAYGMYGNKVKLTAEDAEAE